MGMKNQEPGQSQMHAHKKVEWDSQKQAENWRKKKHTTHKKQRAWETHILANTPD